MFASFLPKEQVPEDDGEEIPVEDTLFDASRLIVEAIERVGQGHENPMIQPWLKQALTWAVAGLGFNAEDASNTSNQDGGGGITVIFVANCTAVRVHQEKHAWTSP